MSDLGSMQKRALEVRQKYVTLNTEKGRNTWSAKDYAMGFAGDIGDLMKLVMAKENMRSGEDVDAKLAHELSDCLWSLLVLASDYNVDLKREFGIAMDALEVRIKEQGR